MCSSIRSRPSAMRFRKRPSGFVDGGLVALPTDTLYGLAADPFSAAAVARVFAVKGRAAERALPLIAADAAQVAAHLGRLPAAGQRLAERFWPGPLTLLMPAPRALARDVTGGTGRVGVRVPADAVARAICAEAGRPITATSANISGEPATADPDRGRAHARRSPRSADRRGHDARRRAVDDRGRHRRRSACWCAPAPFHGTTFRHGCTALRHTRPAR